MATSLVAALHAVSDTPITLVGGHDGIYEIAVDGDLIYANQGSCAQGFPAMPKSSIKSLTASASNRPAP